MLGLGSVEQSGVCADAETANFKIVTAEPAYRSQVNIRSRATEFLIMAWRSVFLGGQILPRWDLNYPSEISRRFDGRLIGLCH